MTPAIIGLAAAVVVAALAAAWRLYLAPARDGHDTRPAPAYEGATEDWSPLATVGAQTHGHELDPEPTLMDTHAELTAIGDALVQFGRRIDAALWEFIRPLDADTVGKLLAAREWAADPATGELDLAELHALLRAGRELTRA